MMVNIISLLSIHFMHNVQGKHKNDTNFPHLVPKIVTILTQE
jgi:hypothetical protein